VQRDLPASLTVNATYLGTHGTHLIQEFLPNTYPAGAVNPCPTPAGYAFPHLGRQLIATRRATPRRRRCGGLTATVQCTLSKASETTPRRSRVRI
jgi:hypothetical protein